MNQTITVQPSDWKDYELIDTGDQQKLEKFGEFYLVRPYLEAKWKKTLANDVWNKADATFIKTKGDSGYWKTTKKLPESWKIHWQNVTTNVHLAPFKHTGVFPEQCAHWEWMQTILEKNKEEKPEYQPHVLNLFAYTGMASVVCAKTGAKVTHVDSSRSSIGWAKQNQLASGLDSNSIRWILDDVLKFVAREVKRSVKYDAIIMDPPAYGHGNTGEVWNFKKSFPKLIDLCREILVDEPLFILINAYAVSISPTQLEYMTKDLVGSTKGTFESGELRIQAAQSPRYVSTGIFSRFGAK